MSGASRWLDASAPIGPRPATAAAVARPTVSVPASTAFFLVTPACKRPDRWALIVVGPFVGDARVAGVSGLRRRGARPAPATVRAVVSLRPSSQAFGEMCVTDRSRRAGARMCGEPDEVPLVPSWLFPAVGPYEVSRHPRRQLVVVVRTAGVAARSERHDPAAGVETGEVPDVAGDRA